MKNTFGRVLSLAIEALNPATQVRPHVRTLSDGRVILVKASTRPPASFSTKLQRAAIRSMTRAR